MVTFPRTAVIGVGFMGQLHATALKNLGDGALATVVDRDPARAQQVGTQLGVRYATDLAQVVEDDSVDAVVIALPDHLHVDAALAVLRAGKPLLLEKPIAHDLPSARSIVRAANDHGTRLMIGHVLRFDPRYAVAARTIADGAIGDILQSSAGRVASRIEGTHAREMSSLAIHLGIHDADILQWVTGRRITRVYAKSASKLMPRLGIEQEDVVTSTIEFNDGSVGTLFSGWSRLETDPVGIDGRLEIIGTDGTLEVDVRDHGVRITTAAGIALPDAMHWPQVHGRTRGSLAAEVRHFCTAVAEDREFVISVDEALNAVAVCAAIDRSLASGQAETVDMQTASGC